jgi:hypothetical protein
MEFMDFTNKDDESYTSNVKRILSQAAVIQKLHRETKAADRKAMTTAAEMFRLILVMDLPEATTLFSKLKHPLTRAQLDARQSGHDEVAATVAYWEQFADLYNNPDTPVRSMVYEYEGDGPTAKKGDCRQYSEDGFSLCEIFDKTDDLEPSLCLAREGNWCKKKVLEIRNFLHRHCRPGYGFFKYGTL